jgi:hypothetical protein
MRVLPAVLLAACLLPACEDAGSTTQVRLELYAPYEGKSDQVQDVLEASGGADLIELVALQASDPFGTQITKDLNLLGGQGRLPALPFADDYWFFARGFLSTDAESVPLFYGATAGVVVQEGEPVVVTLQVGRADCIGLNRSSPYGRDPDGTDDMGGRRVGATLTELPTGEVLIVGGASVDPSGNVTEVFDTIELYDPASSQFLPLDLRLDAPRAWHTATLLSDGRVLIVGGQTGPGGEGAAPVTSAAVVIEVGFTFSVRAVTEGMPEGEGRAHHAATRLNDGRGTVLISGGIGPDGAPLSSVFRYFPGDRPDGAGDRLLRQGALWVPRAFHSQSRLIRDPDLALVAGGLAEGNAPQASIEVFTLREGQEGCANPDQRPTAEVGCFVRLPQSLWLAEARWGHAAVEVEGGRQILIAGGFGGPDRADSFPTSLELIDDQLQRRTAGTLPTGRGDLSATVLPDDSVLLLGGRRGDSPVAVSERLRPRREDTNNDGTADRVAQYEVGELSAACELSEPRFGHQAVRMRSGVVLIGGGVTGVRGALIPSRRGELYFPRVRDLDRVYPQP